MKTEDLKDIICSDLGISSPEMDTYTECYTFGDNKNKGLHNAASKFGIISRYYEDNFYVRSYCVMDYDGGIMILYEKDTKCYSVIVLGEDDGNWFPVDSWNFSKTDFIMCYSEALSMFNNNFIEKC